MSQQAHAEPGKGENELVVTGVMSEINAAFNFAAGARHAVTKAQKDLMNVARGSATAAACAESIRGRKDSHLHLLGLKGAAYVNAAYKQLGTSGQERSILLNSARGRFRTRLHDVVGIAARESLAWERAVSRRIVVIVSFPMGDGGNTMPEHASVELSLHTSLDGPAIRCTLTADRLTTFGADPERGRTYHDKIVSDLRGLKIAEVAGEDPDRVHFNASNKGLSFAFALDRAFDPSASAEKTLEEYITVFAGWADGAPMAATLVDDLRTLFHRVADGPTARDVDDDEDVEWGS